MKTELVQFAAIQPLTETKQAPMPQELELLWLDKQLTGPGEKYDVFFVVVVFVDIPESIGSSPQQILNKNIVHKHTRNNF